MFIFMQLLIVLTVWEVLHSASVPQAEQWEVNGSPAWDLEIKISFKKLLKMAAQLCFSLAEIHLFSGMSCSLTETLA